MKSKQHKVDSKYIWSLIAFFIMALFFSWSMDDTFNELIQEVLYPYSKYPVVVHTSGEIIILPGFVFMWIIVISAINHILLTTFEKKSLKFLKKN
ncbi:hypothetical protein MSP8886_02772 [Marinomonas spartinae]|uniref:Uncharacterized protein n=1 Tax=Marinomonas spartinae TaxID=1792290 RepID=A0A1A8TL69_9GAMM|nr:hypothetical protein MSP8886_02772 [Marinomonas spartinae]